MVDQAARRLGHEIRDINVRAVAWFAFGLIVAAIFIHFALAAVFVFFKQKHPSPEAPSRVVIQPQVIAPQPRLQIDAPADLAHFRQWEEEKLNSYGWIDKKRGIARIPIERAMDLIAERGLPTRGPGTQNSSGKTSEQMRQEKATATKP
jgi:cell division protein FtsN